MLRSFGIVLVLVFSFLTASTLFASEGKSESGKIHHNSHPDHDHPQHDYLKKLDEGLNRKRNQKKVQD